MISGISIMPTKASSPRIRTYSRWKTKNALLAKANWTFDLSLPSIVQSLPHSAGRPEAFIPAYKIAKNPRTRVSMILGIPTVKRDHQSYLMSTLKSVISNLSESEIKDCLIVVFIAETDKVFIKSVSDEIMGGFSAQIDEGLVEIVAPPSYYYPDMNSLRQTMGDDPERVQWRTKQNLDYAFLMMYAQWRGDFYVQLEDDILTKPGFLTAMKDFALDKTAAKEPWFVIDFCQLGFIGKMFKSSQLHILIQFFLMFYNDKPVDWLLENVIQTKVCKLDQDYRKCKKEKASLWLHYKPSLFQHIGTHSSLKGKVQKLKDKQFGKVPLFVPHKNPPATIETNIKHYKHYSLSRAYRGETFFWGLVPQKGDKIEFILDPPIELDSLRFVSGNAEHPSDRFVSAIVDMLPAVQKDRKSDLPFGYQNLATFDSNGVAEGKILPSEGPIHKVRITVLASSDNWAILSEIDFEVRKEKG
ncbi:alpha-1,3-mannosyl-glycoprotein 4-beta-N-acetylglucosaminyltransferase B isoform X2 [Lepeophtheirus salmonis]|uniref:alpha-1,3-mannosyl-glycoprotein 4-beta-N-acetylglucosaminyltransferase B isoform X2 n=1 Tax=Lepeophtheirus salmonis TaxID=72036 RepID=UPI001AE46911|nr:alpha-1,3-mannosyl-glycoprotein 4-beta-N-acetylglucosaminyltransferase B-like isoform X2 [Lepeophtheirus salmonis]